MPLSTGEASKGHSRCKGTRAGMSLMWQCKSQKPSGAEAAKQRDEDEYMARTRCSQFIPSMISHMDFILSGMGIDWSTLSRGERHDLI